MKIYTGKSKPIRVAIAAVALWLANAGELGAIPSPEQHGMLGTAQRVEHETTTIVVAGGVDAVVAVVNKLIEQRKATHEKMAALLDK